MPVIKLGELRESDTDPSSITLNIRMQKVLCCSACGETQFGLRRVRDESNRKIKPAKYICGECYARLR